MPPIYEVSHGFPIGMREAKQANAVMDYVFTACQLALQTSGHFLLEHPEDLGLVQGGERPASIWQFPQCHDLLTNARVATWALFQCSFGACTPKPTRFLGTCKPCHDDVFFGLPRFSPEGRFGPLPHKLIGRSVDGSFRAADAASDGGQRTGDEDFLNKP